jgi:hypothetical protein
LDGATGWLSSPPLTPAGGQISYRFHARDLHLVMGPAAPGTFVRFRVLIDGQPPGAADGTDVDGRGNGTVSQQRLYQLIRQPGRITDRTFEIPFFDLGGEPQHARIGGRAVTTPLKSWSAALSCF